MTKSNKDIEELLIKQAGALLDIEADIIDRRLNKQGALSIEQLNEKLLNIRHDLIDITKKFNSRRFRNNKHAAQFGQLVKTGHELWQQLNTETTLQLQKDHNQIQTMQLTLAAYALALTFLYASVKDDANIPSQTFSIITKAVISTGLGLALAEPVMTGWRAAKEITQRLRPKAGNSFLLYYFKETGKEYAKHIYNDCRSCADKIMFDAYYVKESTRRMAKRTCRRVRGFRQAHA